MIEPKDKRAAKRKFKSIFIRFGLEAPQFKAAAIQISTQGLFISTPHPVYRPGICLNIEISTPNGTYSATAVVRHAKNLPCRSIQYERSGMGVKFLNPPQEVTTYLASL